MIRCLFSPWFQTGPFYLSTAAAQLLQEGLLCSGHWQDYEHKSEIMMIPLSSLSDLGRKILS